MLEIDTQKFIPLTDKTIKDTQAKIENTIHLDFDSFVNSAFLRQGQSNEFSKKSPKERKEILANILGLTKYESLRKKAHEKVRILTAEKSGIQLLQESIQAEIQLLLPVIDEQVSLTERIDKNNVLFQQLEQQKIDLEKQHAAIMHKQQLQEHLLFKRTLAQQDYEKKLEQWKSQVLEWRTIHQNRGLQALLPCSISKNKKYLLNCDFNKSSYKKN